MNARIPVRRQDATLGFRDRDPVDESNVAPVLKGKLRGETGAVRKSTSSRVFRKQFWADAGVRSIAK